MTLLLKKTLKTLWVLPLTVFLLTSVAQADANPANPNMSQQSMQVDSAGSQGMKESMNSGMDKMQHIKMTGDVDIDFAMMMKIHHQQALDMAKMELANGQSPEMKAIAKKIINAQKKEIAQFDHWLNKQK